MEKRDIPIKSIVEDQFRLSHYVSGLCEFLRQTDKPVTPYRSRVNGAVAKTSFMNMIEDELVPRHREVQQHLDKYLGFFPGRQL